MPCAGSSSRWICRRRRKNVCFAWNPRTMWAWRRSLRSAYLGHKAVDYRICRNVTQLARAFPGQTVLSLNLREAGQNAREPPIEAVRYGGEYGRTDQTG